jgi:glycosyltransferase involved in cell wall biosynthesis
VTGLFALARPSVVAWVLVVGAVGLAIVATPVVAGRLRARADPDDEPVAGPAPGALHVLHLGFEDPAMPGSGGGAKRTGEIDRRLAAAGHRVTVVTTRFPGARDRTEVHGAGAVRWVHVGVGRGANRLTRLLGYVTGLPFAVRSIDADVVVEDFFAPISSMGVPWFSPRPTAGVVQWLNAREKAREYKLPVHWVERLAVRSHRHLIAMSRGVADQLAVLSPRAEIAVIGNGVDAAAFDTAVREVADRRDVVFVGRLEIAQKGLDLLIDAWARVAPLVEGRLVVAGTGPDEDVLRARVEHLGLADRVHFAGWVAGREKYELFASGRVAAVPSRFETFGIVAVEALATGTAVVAFDIDCLREVVPTDPVAAGVLVPLSGDHETDVAAYATALHRTLGETDVRATAAARGPGLAAVHDWDALAAAQDAFLRHAAGDRAASA